MGAEVAKQIVLDAGYCVDSEMRLPNEKGSQMRLATGQVVNIYDTGTVVVQGVNPEPVKVLFLSKPKATFKRDLGPSSISKPVDLFACAANVFVVR